MKVRTVKEQFKVIDEILEERFKLIAPMMEQEKIDVWVIPSKEYNEDPIFDKLTPARFLTARRVSILVLHNDNGTLRKYCVNRPDPQLQRFYELDYDLENESQLEALNRVLKRCNAKTIGLNYAADFAYSDGLSVGLYNWMKDGLDKELVEKFVSAEMLGVKFLEKRTDLELSYWNEVMDVAMSVIEGAFSNEVIKPGVTTCDDVEEFMVQSVNDMGLTCWFLPTIDVQRKEGPFRGETIIERGDLIHCDFGIFYLGLCTDTQRNCYVLKEGECELPEELATAFKTKNNRFQDIVCEHFKVGKTGNEVLMESLAQGVSEGIKPCLYTHPLGMHGHAAGPTIGLWNQQSPIAVKGDVPLADSTGYALELNVKVDSEMYGREIRLASEESVVFKGGEVYYLAKGRENIYVVGKK